MKLNIVGGSAEKRNLCADFAHHVTNDICGSRLYKVLDLEIQLISGLADTYQNLGNCVHLDFEPRPREFEIELDAELLPRFMLTTLAHEIVHMKQLAKGQLKFFDNGIVRWIDAMYPKTRPGHKKYSRLPWEIEAIGLEETLFREWAESNKISDDWVLLDMFEHE
jgi:hypothetical protein